MSNVYQMDNKKFEERYGPAIAQFLCDELEVTKKLDAEKIKNDSVIKAAA